MRIMSWQNVTLVGILVGAVTLIQLFAGPDNTEARSTVLALVSILGAWVSSSRAVEQTKTDVEALRQEIAAMRERR